MPPFNPFPVAKLPQLEKPPIELIVGQVRVPLIPALLQPPSIAVFQTLARGDYPHLRREEQVALRFSNEEGPRGDAVQLWRFEDVSHRWTLTVAPDYVAVETREYQNFKDFRDRLVKATTWYERAYGCTLRTRVGLRYVDRFSREKYPNLGPDWLDQINPELLSLAKRAPSREQRLSLEHRFALDDRWGLTFRMMAGFSGGNVDGKSELVLDVDAFNHAEIGFDDLPGTLDSLKAIDNSAFGWAANGLLAILDKA